ncbi:MAG: CBS domain-containing protein [Bacteroidota bacterium]|nr:CBS domain-containing protein [Bacteroidota bacterium]
MDLNISELVNTHPRSVKADTPIHEAEQIMLDHKILSVLVEEEGKIVGVCQLYSIYGNR